MQTHDTPDAGRELALHAIRDRNEGLDGATQRKRLLEALEALGSVTPYEASRYPDTYHPPARAEELRRDGQGITTLRRPVHTGSGVRHSVGVYLPVRGLLDAERQP